MRKYDSYKDSGIEWIGEIPTKWNVKKIKHRCYVKARVGWKGLKSDEFLTEGYSYLVTGSDFKNDAVNWNECYHIDKDRYEEDPYIQLQEEDLLITKDGTIGKLAIVEELDKPACLNSGIFVVRSINEDFNTKFLFWILKSKAFIDFNEFTSYGSTIQHLYQNVFVEFAFPFPSPEEQTAIAAYLDRKTAEIDDLIADKKRLLELYEEEKTAIINQAVTKGINPDVPMKDSGIEWLGEIPEHWEVKRLKYLAKIGNGKDHKGVWDDNGEYPIYGTGGVFGKAKECLYDKPSVLLGRKGTIDKPQFVEEPFWTVDTAYYTLINEEIIIPYYFFLLTTTINFNQFKYGSAVPSMTQEVLKDILFAVPSIQEQQSIVQHIKTECAHIDAKKSKTEKLIELLTEYRTALISEVVTGKIKVIE